jgi:hypothetical protein
MGHRTADADDAERAVGCGPRTSFAGIRPQGERCARMPHDHIDGSYFSADILDFIELLHRHQVRYVVVGGEAVIYYGHARLTGDIDFFYDAAAENVLALFRALLEFWSGHIPGIAKPEELQEEGVIIQFGRPPNRIDLLNRIDGVTFPEAWLTRTSVAVEGPKEVFPLHYLALDKLIRNKELAGRPKDLEDLAYLKNQSSSPA